MSDMWKQWEGHAVNGKFPLLRYLGGTEHSAVFLTEREADPTVQAAIKLVSLSPEGAQLQLSRWRQAAELSHPGLISLYEMGRRELGGMPLLYVVMELADDSLAQVLPDRALTPDEGRAMLKSVLDVLAYLHGRGFVHGRIKPQNILAANDELKLSSDGICRAGDPPLRLGYPDPHDPPETTVGITSTPPSMSPAGDVWSLGGTLVEALTQSLPTLRAEECEGPSLPALQEPFLDIAGHCLLRHPQSRWTVSQIAARLEGRRAPVPHFRAAQSQISPPARGSQPVARPSAPRAKRRVYIAPIAVGFVLVLAAMIAGPRLLRRNSEPPQATVITVTQPLTPPESKQVARPPQATSSKSFEKSIEKEEPSSTIPVPVPTSVHPETVNSEENDAVAKVPGGEGPRGAVAQQVAPEVLQSARDTIRGTVRVTVTVNVDRLGNVEDAELESPGPSKYFARAALDAAKLWKFKPPKIGGQGVLSSWTLHFEFTRDGTRMVPSQETP